MIFYRERWKNFRFLRENFEKIFFFFTEKLFQFLILRKNYFVTIFDIKLIQNIKTNSNKKHRQQIKYVIF